MTLPTSKSKLVTVFGASGFLGRYVTQSLAKRGFRVRAAVRRPDRAHHLQPLGVVGQIHAVQANLRYPWSVERALVGADAAVNLVGILAETGRQSFASVQAEGAEAIGRAARDAGVATLVHISAIGADAASESLYARTKAEGEAGVREAVPGAIVLRPSIVFGPEDDFFNRFANMARFAPALPLIGGGETRFQPVYVGDIGEAVAKAVAGEARSGTTYELGGPEVLTFRECLERMMQYTRRRRALVSIPFGIAGTMGRVMGALPKAPITEDQVKLLKTDNVVSDEAVAEARTLEGLGIDPQSLDSILPTYLWRYAERGQFQNTIKNRDMSQL